MLIEFTVGNYRSFKDPQTWSMAATTLKAQESRVDENNVIRSDGQPDLLTSAAIYGANASGKSNLITAFEFMRSAIFSSPRQIERLGSTGAEPFRLSMTTLDKPSHFQVVAVIKGTRYRYGFEMTPERVVREWLYSVPTTREALLFEREGNTIQSGRHFPEGRQRLIENTRPDALFLGVAAQFNGPIASDVVSWFRRLTTLGMRSGRYAPWRTPSYGRGTLGLLKDGDEGLRALIRELDLGISDIQLEEIPPEEVEDDTPTTLTLERARRLGMPIVRTTHVVYDDDGEPTGEADFDLDFHESEGTRRLFALAGPLLNTLRSGGVLIVDELDARLHPLMTRALVARFNDRQANPKGAQLIFTTQDTNLLDNALFRRDQIWFVEKNRQGASQLYSLAEFKVRNDLSFERGYIQGRFGAVPYLNPNKLNALLEQVHGETA